MVRVTRYLCVCVCIPGVPVCGAILETGDAHAHGKEAQHHQPQVHQDQTRLREREEGLTGQVSCTNTVDLIVMHTVRRPSTTSHRCIRIRPV